MPEIRRSRATVYARGGLRQAHNTQRPKRPRPRSGTSGIPDAWSDCCRRGGSCAVQGALGASTSTSPAASISNAAISNAAVGHHHRSLHWKVVAGTSRARGFEVQSCACILARQRFDAVMLYVFMEYGKKNCSEGRYVSLWVLVGCACSCAATDVGTCVASNVAGVLRPYALRFAYEVMLDLMAQRVLRCT